MGTFIDLTGQKFSRLTVTERIPNNGRRTMWLCECVCGKETTVSADKLRSGHTKSCGCLQPETASKLLLVDISGRRFGRWTAIRRVPNKRPNSVVTLWLCRCDCGTERSVVGATLHNSTSVSCGCYRIEQHRHKVITHGHTVDYTKTVEYQAFINMHKRCYDHKCNSYDDYGGRSIRVCDRWLHNFPAFLQDMGLKPHSDMELNRLFNNGHYSPDNCMWVTRTENQRNKRNTRYVTAYGRKMSLAELVDISGVKRSVIRDRIDRLGWSAEDAATTTSHATRMQP